MGQPVPTDDVSCDVLIVGAGPTGLALAAQLQRFGLSLRVVDTAIDRVHESRALGIQPRTLEVLRPLGLDRELIARGNPTVRLRITSGTQVAHAPLFDIGAEDSAFPFLLFLSQAETERLLVEHLGARGVSVERGVSFETYEREDDALICRLRRSDGTVDMMRTRFLVGCDGAHSTVRERAGIPFVGGRYPQTFVLADLEADGLEPGTVNAYIGEDGPLFFFPLEHPASWRLITMRSAPEAPPQLTLDELQRSVDRATANGVRLHEPVWSSAFRIHHRAAARYRAGSVFLAGDAAHVHSPAGAQGMNTGIQDAVNLGWKLAVARHGGPDALLDSYDQERRSVGEFVLRFTDRAFRVATSTSPLVRTVRSRLVPRILPLALRFRAGRRLAFRTVSQLGISYPRSPLTDDGHRGRRPRAGERLPDARVQRDGTEIWLHEALCAPSFHLLLCGSSEPWDAPRIEDLRARYEPFLTVVGVVPAGGPGCPQGWEQLSDHSGALARLGVRGNGHLLIRPDGHLGYRSDGTSLVGVASYLARWTTVSPASGVSRV